MLDLAKAQIESIVQSRPAADHNAPQGAGKLVAIIRKILQQVGSI